MLGAELVDKLPDIVAVVILQDGVDSSAGPLNHLPRIQVQDGTHQHPQVQSQLLHPEREVHALVGPTLKGPVFISVEVKAVPSQLVWSAVHVVVRVGLLIKQVKLDFTNSKGFFVFGFGEVEQTVVQNRICESLEVRRFERFRGFQNLQRIDC